MCSLLALGVLVVGVAGPPDTVATLVTAIQHADYAGDRPALKQLYSDLAPFADRDARQPQVRYWLGFALWRRALNGFNESADPRELADDLTTAAGEFEKAQATAPSFVDAMVGAASCLQNLAVLDRRHGDTTQARQLLQRSLPLLHQAEALDADNPRLLWVLGANRWYAPAAFGGGQSVAIETYERGLRSARARATRTNSELDPTWGEPELLMNLAFANLRRSTPDLAAAEQYARSALALVPYWHYVRDILLPQILAAAGRS